MAHLVVNGDRLRLNFTLLEILGAFHLSPEVALSEVESVEVIENPWVREVLKGVRAPGTGIPFVVMLGTMRYLTGKDLVAIYRRKPAAVVSLKSGPFKRWIFEIKDMSEIDELTKAIA
ncbi:MAG: hypothetical protein ACKOXI_03210 [Candidatus Planktophila sp.]